MAINQLKVTGINPILSVLGDTQRFNYSPDNAFFSIKSNFQPIQDVNSKLSLEFRNILDNGFRITHETDINGGVGQLKFKHFSNSSFIGTDIAVINQNGFTFNAPASFPNPVNPMDAANKQYVDSKTWFTSQIIDFDTSVRTYKLSDFLAPASNVSFANFNLINLANPVNAQDAATKNYVDNIQKTVTLSGAVSGSGSTGSTVATTFNLRLDQIAFPTANINLNGYKINNLGTPTLSNDAVTKSYVDSSVGGVSTSIILQGAISGSGNTGSAITTTLNKTLDQINAPLSSLNLNSQKIINLVSPVSSTDGANKSYVDGKTWVSSQITDFDSQVRLSRLDQMATPTASVNLNSQKIINLATPTLSTDAVNKNYADTSVVSPSRLTGYPASTGVFLRGDGTWASVSSGTVTSVGIIGGTGISVIGSPITSSGNITLSLSGISIGSLSGYPSNVNSVLRGDGTWGSPNFINITSISGYPANGSYVLRGDGAWGYPGYIPIASLAGYPGNSSYFLRGDGAWAVPGGGGANLSSNSINVNTDGGLTNWLRRNINTTTGTQVYGLTSSGYIIENNIGESAGIGFDGSADTCTIWTAGDGGTYLNIQDEDSTNSRAAYVATNGAWTVVSSEKRKHSIRNKTNNNILERFMNLSVKTYGYKYKAEEDSTEKKKTRVEKKSNKMCTGLILEDVFKIFPNCLPGYYNKLFQDKKDKILVFEQEITNPENSGIDYNTLLCYFIMAFQEYVQKTNDKILSLEKKLGTGH